MQRHISTYAFVERVNQFTLNPQQPPAFTADQQVYAIVKQVQWLLPDEYSDVVVMMGPLHIEMTFLDAIGDWLEGSGWVTIFKRRRMTTVGCIDSFLSGLKIKRSRPLPLIFIYFLNHN